MTYTPKVFQKTVRKRGGGTETLAITVTTRAGEVQALYDGFKPGSPATITPTTAERLAALEVALAAANGVSTAEQAAITAAITALKNGAPAALDTLKEIADQLGADETAAAALTNLVTAIRNLTDPTFKTALKNAYARKWQPNTAYTAGEPVVNPSGQIATANTDFTSGSSYNASNWTVVSGGSSGGASGEKSGDSVLDFRSMSDGKLAAVLAASQGTFTSLITNSPNDFEVQNGRAVCLVSGSTCKIQVKVGKTASDVVQHTWMIVEFGANPTTDTTALMLWPGPGYWGTIGGVANGGFPGGDQAAVHDGISSRFNNANTAKVAADRYPGTGGMAAIPTRSTTSGIGDFTGKRVRWDITINKRTGRRRHYIDGVRTIDFTDTTQLNYISQYAIAQFGGPPAHLQIVEFGASPDLPEWEAATNSNGMPNTAPVLSDVTLSSTYQLISTVVVGYKSSGRVKIFLDPYIESTSGNVFMCLGSDTTADAPAIPRRVREGSAKGTELFAKTRTGTPGTTEVVGIWAKTDGTATIRGGSWGGDNAWAIHLDPQMPTS